jgi:hypothetical protein
MKKSIKFQIGLVGVSIVVLIGVLFYNPPDVEKPTDIVVDFGEGVTKVVGGDSAPEEEPTSVEAGEVTPGDAGGEELTAVATPAPADKAAPAAPAPVMATPGPAPVNKDEANTKLEPAVPPGRPARAPRGTVPTPMQTPAPIGTPTPAGPPPTADASRMVFPNGVPTKIETEVK